MKKTLFLSLFFSLLALSGWAEPKELIKLTLKADCNYIGAGCAENLEQAAKKFFILKATPSPSGGIVPDSLSLEKHAWQEKEKDKFTITKYETSPIKTKDGTQYLFFYLYAGPYSPKLSLKYKVGAFDPKTKTQDLTIESIRGLSSLQEEGKETKKTLSFQWKIKQKEDGSLEIWDTKPSFKLTNLEVGMGEEWVEKPGYRRYLNQGATYLERQGEKEIETEDGAKKQVPVRLRETVLKAKSEEPAICEAESSSTIEKLTDSMHSIFSKI